MNKTPLSILICLRLDTGLCSFRSEQASNGRHELRKVAFTNESQCNAYVSLRHSIRFRRTRCAGGLLAKPSCRAMKRCELREAIQTASPIVKVPSYRKLTSHLDAHLHYIANPTPTEVHRLAASYPNLEHSQSITPVLRSSIAASVLLTRYRTHTHY